MDIIEKVFEVVFFRKLTVSEMIFSLVQLFLAEFFFLVEAKFECGRIVFLIHNNRVEPWQFLLKRSLEV